MNILLAAYVCGAGQGSEPGVGWNVARSLALRGHSVTVVTSPLYEAETRAAIRELQLDIRLVIVPNEHYKSNLFIKRHVKWQRAAAQIIRRETAARHFDVVHHVTFNQYRGLRDVLSAGIPYLVGPVGGAETIPLTFLLYGGLTFMARVKELLRYVSADAIAVIRRCNACSSPGKVLASNPSTERRLNEGLFHLNVPAETCPAIAIDENDIEELPTKENPQQRYFLLYASLKRAEKGLLTVLKAMALYYRLGGQCRLLLVGAPEEEHQRIAAYCQKFGLSDSVVEVHAFVARERMLRLMQGASAVLYAAYRDSGSMTVLEALAKGVPVVCFDIPSQRWAPAEWVMKVPVPRFDWRGKQVITEFARALLRAEQPCVFSQESNRRRCEWLRAEMTWRSRVQRLEEEYGKILPLP